MHTSTLLTTLSLLTFTLASPANPIEKRQIVIGGKTVAGGTGPTPTADSNGKWLTSDSPSTSTAESSSSSSSSSSNNNNISINNNICPASSASYTTNQRTYCCPGAIISNEYCCVGGKVQFESCFPFCSDRSNGQQVTTQSCATKVYFTQGDYDAAVSMSATATGTGSGSAATMSSGTTTGTGTGAPGSMSAAAASSNSRAAANAMVTSGPLAGAVMIAGGLMLMV